MRIDVSLDHRDMATELAQLWDRLRERTDKLQGLPAIRTALPELAFHYREVDGEFHVYAEDTARDVLAGCTVFNRVFEVDRRTDAYVRSPHSRYASAYRGQGVASAVYRWALQAGMCLVSGPRQSPGAHRLWMALARSHPLAFIELQQRRLRILGTALAPAELESYDTRLLLLGAGWTLDRFAALAGSADSCARNDFALDWKAPTVTEVPSP
jgi:hypothetical protein